jgi:hypothetical protein
LLLDDAVRLARQAAAADVEVTLDITPGCPTSSRPIPPSSTRRPRRWTSRTVPVGAARRCGNGSRRSKGHSVDVRVMESIRRGRGYGGRELAWSWKEEPP